MNKWVLIYLVLAAAVKLSAQTNAPVRLALISESDEANTVADVLTAQLTGNGKIQLLERDQIEKVYREQGTSEANRDDLKVGRILGADGLLLLDVVRTPQTTNLTARLIAVKPGVVLTDGSFPWPLKDTAQWADSAATYLNSFLPKLTVLAKDAIPISIDANHNGRLDPVELAYFDANNDKILEPKEQAGIDITEHLFAERLMKKFDANGDCVLDRDEFNNLWHSCGFGNNTRGFVPFSEFSLSDENHDGQVDLKELETFLKQQLRQELRPRGAAGAAFFRQLMANPNTTVDPQRTFKAYVEFYWQHPDNFTGGRQPGTPDDHNP